MTRGQIFRLESRESFGAQVALPRRAILAATIGNMLEFYDFVTYSFFAIQIGSAFFPAFGEFSSLMLSLATFGVGFLARPIGALVIGTYADRAGRRRAMVLSLAMMGTAVTVLALTPSYYSIGVAAPILAIIARLVQGFALGGEVGPTTAYLMEAAAVRNRGLVVAWQPASQLLAAMTGALVGFALAESMSSAALASYGWRIAFLIGAIAIPMGLWMRRNVAETLHLSEPETAAMQQAGDIKGMIRDNARLMILGLLILAGGTINAYVRQYMTTYAENTLHVAPDLAFAVTVFANAVGVAGALYGGWQADRAGRWGVMVWPQLALLLLIYPAFLWIVATRSTLALLGGFGVLSFIGTIPYGAFFVAMTEALPKSIRGRALATIYAVAIALFGGTAQLIVTWVIHVTGNALGPAWYMLFATMVGLVAMTMMRETAPVKRSDPQAKRGQ